MSDELLVAAAELLRAPGGRTFVFGQRKSAALAEYAFFLLNPLIPHVLTIEEGAGTVADALIDVGPDDRLLAVTFRPYARLTADVIDWFARAGGAVVLVCDDPLIPPAAHAQHTLVCAPESPGPFASAVAGLFVVEALAAYVAAGTPGGTRASPRCRPGALGALRDVLRRYSATARSRVARLEAHATRAQEQRVDLVGLVALERRDAARLEQVREQRGLARRGCRAHECVTVVAREHEISERCRRALHHRAHRSFRFETTSHERTRRFANSAGAIRTHPDPLPSVDDGIAARPRARLG